MSAAHTTSRKVVVSSRRDAEGEGGGGAASPRSKAAATTSSTSSTASTTSPRAPPSAHHRKASMPPVMGTLRSSPSSTEYEELDQQIMQSATFQDMWRITRLVSAKPTYQAMIEALQEEVALFVKATSVRFLQVNEADGVLTHSRKSWPLNQGLCGRACTEMEIVNIDDPADDTQYSADVDKDPTVGTAGAMLVVPVVSDSTPDCRGHKEVVGLIAAVKARGAGRFTARDCTALYRLGEFAGNTLRNAMRLDRANARYNQSLSMQQRGDALLDIAKALTQENRLPHLVALIVNKVPELLDCDRCTLFFVDHDTQELIVTRGASQGRRRSLVNWVFGQSNAPELPFKDGKNEIRFPMGRGIAGHVAQTGETVNIRDAHLDDRFNPEVDKRTGYRTRSLLCMPLVDADGNIIGVVQAINKNPAYPQFDQEDETLLGTFAAQAAVAVKNSKLFDQTESALKRSDALLEITNALSKELKIGPLIRIIVSKVQNLIGAQRCTVFIVDEEKKQLYTSAHMSYGMGAALPIDTDKAEMIRFPIERGLAGSCATSGATINIPDAYADSRFNQQYDKETGFRTKSILCHPVVSHTGSIIAVTQVINKVVSDSSSNDPNATKIGIFSDDDERMLAAFSAQAAIAIENSRLFTQTERALNQALADQRNLKFLLSVTKNLFSDMHLQSMTQQLEMQVHHLLKADHCALYLVDNSTKEFLLAKDEKDDSKHTRYPFSCGVVGHVASTARTVRLSKDAYLDPRFHPAVDQRKGHTTHSLLCCPIMAETSESTTVIGVISVRDEKDRGGFEREEENLLKVFSAQAAVAIINSKRFSNMLDQSEYKERDHSAAQYLVESRGMKLASDDIDSFQYSMDEITLNTPIGTGSYGEVYKATLHGKTVAVKKMHVRTLKAEQVDSFCSEAGLMCQLDHKNVVLFIGAVTEPSNLSIITEFCSRGSLADMLLDPQVEITYPRKVQALLDAAYGMLYLHQSNPTILHRDLKSDNLLVSADWTVKVADFGLTRFMSTGKAMTQVGTPMWMAPEVICGSQYSEKADVYAFGIIIWEVLTRLEPYDEMEPMSIVVAVVNDGLRPTIPAEYAKDPLVPLMKDCWAQDPGERPTFQAIIERLEAVKRGLGGGAPAVPAIIPSAAAKPGAASSATATAKPAAKKAEPAAAAKPAAKAKAVGATTKAKVGGTKTKAAASPRKK